MKDGFYRLHAYCAVTDHNNHSTAEHWYYMEKIFLWNIHQS